MGWYSFIEGARHDGAPAAAVTLPPAGGDRRDIEALALALS